MPCRTDAGTSTLRTTTGRARTTSRAALFGDNSMTSGDWANMMGLTSGYGFGGIAADAAHPGTFIVYDDRSGGRRDLPLHERRPEHSNLGADRVGGRRAMWRARPGSWATHPSWGRRDGMGDVEIDPFDPAHALYITGGGIWSSDDVTDADKGVSTHWTFRRRWSGRNRGVRPRQPSNWRTPTERGGRHLRFPP